MCVYYNFVVVPAGSMEIRKICTYILCCSISARPPFT